MAGGIDWFRWHHGSVTDQKFQLVARQAGASVAEVVAVWASLLEAASQSDDRGHPGDPDFEAIDCSLGMSDGRAASIYSRMTSRGLITEDGRIHAWDRRQPKRERDDDLSTDRVKAFRARKRQEEERNALERTETPEKRQETPRGEERREEKEDSVPNGTGATASLPLIPPAEQLRDEQRTAQPDAIWDAGLEYLVSKGNTARAARGFLGQLRKTLGNDLEVAEILAKAQEQDVSEPLAWLRAAARRRLNGGRSHTGVAL